MYKNLMLFIQCFLDFVVAAVSLKIMFELIDKMQPHQNKIKENIFFFGTTFVTN